MKKSMLVLLLCLLFVTGCGDRMTKVKDLRRAGITAMEEGDYQKAADTWGRIVDLLRNEWGFTEEAELRDAESEKARLSDLSGRHVLRGHGLHFPGHGGLLRPGGLRLGVSGE